MYQYHEDRKTYFEHQRAVTEEHVLPFIENSWRLPSQASVLEVGCGEAGVLKAFIDRGCRTVGVDLNAKRLQRGRELLADSIRQGRLELIHRDIYTPELRSQLTQRFDLIVLKDVVEHMEDKNYLLDFLRTCLRPSGRVFFGFPPWFMPFGGHQQVCRTKLSRAPYIHLLPRGVYRRLLLSCGESPACVDGLLQHKTTGINTRNFEHVLEQSSYEVVARRFYLINPMYRYRFGLRSRHQNALVARVPYARDLVSTCAYYLVRPTADPTFALPRERGASRH